MRVVCNLIDGNGQLITVIFSSLMDWDWTAADCISLDTLSLFIRTVPQFSEMSPMDAIICFMDDKEALHAAAHKRNFIIAAALDRYGKVAVRQRLDDVRQLPDECDHNVRCA